jgi:ribonuclease R
VPVGSLGGEWWRFDAGAQTLTGERSGQVLAPGAKVRARLVEAAPMAGGLRLELLEVEEGALGAPRTMRGRGKGGPKRKLARAKIAAAKARRQGRRAR